MVTFPKMSNKLWPKPTRQVLELSLPDHGVGAGQNYLKIPPSLICKLSKKKPFDLVFEGSQYKDKFFSYIIRAGQEMAQLGRCQRSGKMFARQGRVTRTRRSSCCKAPWMGSPGRGKDVKGEECPSTLPCTGSLCPEERPIPALISIFTNDYSRYKKNLTR